MLKHSTECDSGVNICVIYNKLIGLNLLISNLKKSNCLSIKNVFSRKFVDEEIGKVVKFY